MNELKLRKRIERRTRVLWWGQPRYITPRLVARTFGDGKQWIGLAPIMYRPNHFIVRIDSAWSLSNWDTSGAVLLIDHIDEIYDAIEEEFYEWPWARYYGLSGDEKRIGFADGSVWWGIEHPRRTTPQSEVGR